MMVGVFKTATGCSRAFGHRASVSSVGVLFFEAANKVLDRDYFKSPKFMRYVHEVYLIPAIMVPILT